MIETQAGINEWAEATFGPCPDIRRMVARANEEMSELLSQITMPIPDNDKIAEECADICGPLFRVAAWADEDLMPIFRLETLIVPGELYGPAVRANGIMSFTLERLSIGNVVQRRDIGRHVAMIVIKLAEICAACGIPLGDAIDRKMAICRARDWKLDGSGCGYHRLITPEKVAAQHGYKWENVLEARERERSNSPITTQMKMGKDGPEVVGELYDCGHIHRTFEEAQQCERWLTNPREGSNARSGA